MYLFHTNEATLGNQYGGRPASNNKNQQREGKREWLWLCSGPYSLFVLSSLSHFPPTGVAFGFAARPQAQVLSFSPSFWREPVCFALFSQRQQLFISYLKVPLSEMAEEYLPAVCALACVADAAILPSEE